MPMVVTVPSKSKEERDADQLEFVNSRLREYMDHEDYSQYSSLIRAVLEDTNSIGAKYNLWTLIMNHGTNKITINNLRDRLQNLYCSDNSIEEYINSIVQYNPKLGYVSVSSKSGLDSKNDYSLDIKVKVPFDPDLDKQFAEADRIIDQVKEVMRMILMESKTIP